ncbi:MAG: permease of phosphate ABC transporter [Eubacteriaceae bacterium]|nr:permease of phosphate ABC transporter [Eubacteriaceae bacterium]
MKEIFNYVRRYKNQMNLVDFTLFKFCLLSAGILFGLGVSKNHRKKAAACAGITFAVTYGPLITKFLGIVMEESQKSLDEAN